MSRHMSRLTRPFAPRASARLARLAILAVTAVALAGACATTPKPAALTQAETIYNRLATTGANERAEADLIRARQAIDDAQRGMTESGNRDYRNGLANIALRAAQTAEANNERLLAMSATDSLTKARLARSLSASEQARQNLQQQNQLSEAENAALRARTDSLRRANAEANARLDSALTRLRTLVVEITNLQETTRGLVISLSDILFDVNKATLKPGAETNVRRIAAILQQYPDKQIVVEGHTDATGSDAYNQKLSEDRAAAVRAALVAGGVGPSVITSRGFGKTQPVATNDTPAGRQQNRRVEVVVLGAGRLADAANPPAMPAMPPSGDTTSRTPPR